MIKLTSEEYMKIAHLVKSHNELSVFSVINCVMPGEILVNNLVNPTAVLIKTCECNLIAGSPKDEVFNSEISTQLNFWEQLTPDSIEWFDKIALIHGNPFIRKYKRRHYELAPKDFVTSDNTLPEGYAIEKVNPAIISEKALENSEKLLYWVENWGEPENFQRFGSGYYVHNNKVIVSWSISDCSFEDRIAIGVHTDERYRKSGFGKIAVSATIKDCFDKGYQKIEWLCVDTNRGSIAIAEKLGFKLKNDYFSFTSFPPIENVGDLSEAEWHEWAEYLEAASEKEERLVMECVHSYIKANDVEKTIKIMLTMKNRKVNFDLSRFNNYVIKLQSCGLCSNFKDKVWGDFVNKNTVGNCI